MKIVKAEDFKRTPPMMLIYGAEGIGKTTFAAQAPSPIFVKTEEGFPVGVSSDSFELCKTFADVMDCLKSLATEEHNYRTVVIDYLDGIEMLIHRDILRDAKSDSMATACGGYGRAFSIVNNKMLNELLPALIELRDRKNMWVIILAHSSVTEVADPIDGNYQHFEPACAHEGWIEQFKNSSDCVFFATGHLKNTNIGTNANKRVFKTQATNKYAAKNRFSDAEEIDLDFKAVCESFKQKQTQKQ